MRVFYRLVLPISNHWGTWDFISFLRAWRWSPYNQSWPSSSDNNYLPRQRGLGLNFGFVFLFFFPRSVQSRPQSSSFSRMTEGEKRSCAAIRSEALVTRISPFGLYSACVKSHETEPSTEPHVACMVSNFQKYSSLKVYGKDSMICRRSMKLDRNEDTRCRHAKRCWTELVRLQALRDQFTSEHLWLNLSINSRYYVIPNEPLNHNLDKKRLQKRHRTLRRDREPRRIPIRTLQRLTNKNRKVREFVYKCMCSSIPPSSKMHCFSKHKLKLKSSETLRKSILKKVSN